MIDVVRAEDCRFLALSDMHIGTKRTAFRDDDQLLDDMIRRFRQVDKVILNGDTLDLTYHLTNGKRDADPQGEELQGIHARMDKLLPKLVRMLEACPDTEFHYIEGNHDGLDVNHERLQALSQRYPKLHVHREGMVMGDALFIHGDQHFPAAYENMQMNDTFRRERRVGRGQPGEAEQAMYKEIYRKLQETCDLSGISRVFFGHTHLPVSEYRVPGATASLCNSGGFFETNEAYVFSGSIRNGCVADITHEKFSTEAAIGR